MELFSRAFIILRKLPVFLPPEIVRNVHAFLMWDITSLSFALHLKNRDIDRAGTLYHIDHCMSRKNGFLGQEPCDTENEHWAFGLLLDELGRIMDDRLSFQAIHCAKCGNYVSPRLPYGSVWSFCFCR